MLTIDELKEHVGDEKFQQAQEEGFNTLKEVRENGFRRTYEKRFPNVQLNYDIPEVIFDFTYFVATIVSTDTAKFLNGLFEGQAGDEKLADVVSVFSIQLDQVVTMLKGIMEISSQDIMFVEPNGKEEWEKFLHARGEYISGLLDVCRMTSGIMAILVGNDIDYIDGMDELMEDMKEFYLAVEKMEEVGGNGNNEED